MVVGRILKYAVALVVVVGLLIGLGYFLGVFGLPTLNGIDNQFGTVNETTTEIETSVGITNPNPIGFSLGGLSINYSVAMNDVPMASGDKQGVSIGTGNSSLELTTYLDNTQIPEWWYTHISNGESSEAVIDAEIGHSLFGSTTIERSQTVQTDILSGFDSQETRPIDANQPLIDDPVLYINETAAAYGDEVTRERTPMNMEFTVYNPKPFPYTITEIGYTIDMNNVTVGEGSSEQPYTIAPESGETIAAETVIRNERLDEWWVSHIQNDEVTDLHVDFYVVVQPDIPGQTVDPIRLDSDELDYRTTIETDILGSEQ